jgi:branched-chain amino acid transport system substrate-binding protein
MLKKVLSVAVLLLVSVFSLCLTGCDKEKEDYLVIGGMGPLTGPAAVYGIAVHNSAKMAVEEINANGGLANGLKLKLEFLDDAHDATKVQGNYYDLLENKGMQVSLGCVTTKPCLEFKKLSVDDNLFFITPSASNDEVPAEKNGFQMCFADGKQGAYAANYVNDNYKNQTIGVFYKADDDYSKGIFDLFKTSVDTTVTLVETSFTGEGTDFSTQIATLKEAGVKFVFMPIYYTPASLFMSQAKDANAFANDVVFFGCDGFDGIESMDGFSLSSIPQEVSMLSHFDSSVTTGAAGTYIANYKEKYGADTLNQFGASAYDCIYALVKALNEIEAANPGTVTKDAKVADLGTLLEAKFTSADFTFTGVTGGGKPMTWDASGTVNKSALKFTLKEADAE